MPGSNAYSGRARGLMINFHAESRPKPSDAISHAISPADVFFDACECLSYDNDNAHVDADVFFDTREFFGDNAEIETRANDIISDKTCSSIRMSSLWRARPAAGRVARRGGPAPALAPFPVPGCSSLWTASCCWGGGWCWCGSATHATRSVAACNRGPPSSTSASTSGLSRPVLPRRLWRVVGWVGFLSDVIGGVKHCGRGVTPH
jgi:hypothetical protein